MVQVSMKIDASRISNNSGRKLPKVPPKDGQSRFLGIYDSAGS